jgi:hypothetical protein
LQILFPLIKEDMNFHVYARYIDGTLVGYRILSGDGDHVKESNYPNLTKQSILPFPHGLYEVIFIYAIDF